MAQIKSLAAGFRVAASVLVSSKKTMFYLAVLIILLANIASMVCLWNNMLGLNMTKYALLGLQVVLAILVGSELVNRILTGIKNSK